MAVQLSYAQAQFAGELSHQTGLSPNVIAAWLRNEEPAEATNTPNHGLYNFLNVGITDRGSYGYANPVWKNPITAAQATANWIKGKPIGAGGYSSTDYPAASGGIRAILASAKSGPEAQITAIQGSGWASGGEAALRQLYNEVLGGTQFIDPKSAQGVPSSTLGVPNNPLGLPGGTNVGGTVSGAVDSVVGAASSAAGTFAAIGNDIAWVFNNWLRIFEFLGGVILGISGLVLLGRVGKERVA